MLTCFQVEALINVRNVIIIFHNSFHMEGNVLLLFLKKPDGLRKMNGAMQPLLYYQKRNVRQMQEDIENSRIWIRRKKMNKQRRKQLDKSFVLINEAMDIIQGVMDDEQEAYDNLPESFQNGERGEQMSGNIESLEEAAGYLEEAKSAMEDI